MKKEMLVGAVFILALALVAFGTIAVSGLSLFTAKETWYVQLDDAGGLEEGDDVLVRGHRMGVVGRLRYNRDGNRFRVSLRMNKTAPIYEGYRITVRDASTLGGKYLHIEPGDPGKGDADFKHLQAEGGMSDVMGQLAEVLTELKKVSKDIVGGRGTLGKLVTDEQLYDDLRVTAASVREISSAVKDGKGTLGRLISDDGLHQQLVDIVDRLNNGEGALAKLMRDESGPIVDDLRSAADRLDSIIAKIDTGQGTMGLLVNEPALYENVNSTFADARTAMSDVDQVIEDTSAMIQHLRNASAKIDNGEGTVGKLINDSSLFDDARRLMDRAIDSLENARDSAPVSAVSSFILGPFQ